MGSTFREMGPPVASALFSTASAFITARRLCLKVRLAFLVSARRDTKSTFEYKRPIKHNCADNNRDDGDDLPTLNNVDVGNGRGKNNNYDSDQRRPRTPKRPL
jgi:hypothetical protein